MCIHILIHLDFNDTIICSNCGDIWSKTDYVKYAYPKPRPTWPVYRPEDETVKPQYTWTDSTLTYAMEN
jgi:hypothetical protein